MAKCVRFGGGGGGSNNIFPLFDLLFKFELVDLFKKISHDMKETVKSSLQLFSVLGLKKGGGGGTRHCLRNPISPLRYIKLLLEYVYSNS